jgi:hypothetical protein
VVTPLFPAAATRTAPLAVAYATASASAWVVPVPPRLMLMTRAPWSVAHTMPRATVDVVPEPFASSTLTGMSAHCQQRPATPSRLSERAAATPAAAVP